MKPSPIGSRLLSLYAISFCCLVPAVLLITGLAQGTVSISLALGNLGYSLAIGYYGVRVFAGDYSATKEFAILVALNYLGLTVANAWYINDFPEGSRAAQMAVPRMIRGVLFACVYIWYYLIRKRTAFGFMAATGSASPPTLGEQSTVNHGNSLAKSQLPVKASVSTYCTACKRPVEIDKFESRCPLCGWPI